MTRLGAAIKEELAELGYAISDEAAEAVVDLIRTKLHRFMPAVGAIRIPEIERFLNHVP